MGCVIRLAFLVPIVILGVADSCIFKKILQTFTTLLVLLL